MWGKEPYIWHLKEFRLLSSVVLMNFTSELFQIMYLQLCGWHVFCSFMRWFRIFRRAIFSREVGWLRMK